jgi:hypothetical protein
MVIIYLNKDYSIYNSDNKINFLNKNTYICLFEKFIKNYYFLKNPMTMNTIRMDIQIGGCNDQNW